MATAPAHTSLKAREWQRSGQSSMGLPFSSCFPSQGAAPLHCLKGLLSAPRLHLLLSHGVPSTQGSPWSPRAGVPRWLFPCKHFLPASFALFTWGSKLTTSMCFLSQRYHEFKSSCMTLGKSLDLSEPQFLHLGTEVPALQNWWELHETSVRSTWDSVWPIVSIQWIVLPL